ncbi:DUF732 domain-containing protein [Rhodococcus sp. AG1013]|jgi:Protein of unknown function (DUF732)|uniref:DUF732 domain-containing protein n=1 Tax=unclassified Rhodococcus (in: high G+C Gram-positive bacteria) TaxID=192944 RepID=UPI000E0CB461|nr:DUF732 domain-containing protein [Rhodococcus sp. AG1013]RDI16216.1 uncharacterized protein DUF732 [Rhodococcus sp. AG1013]
MHFLRTRSALARTVAVGAMTLAAGSLLVACGDDDTTATGSPTTTTAAASTTSKAPSGGGASAAPAAPEQTPAQGSGGGATQPVEEPQAVPSGFPGPTEVPISPRGEAFLNGLKKEGITPASDGFIAVSTADYICAAGEQGSSDAEIATFVTAAVGSEASAAGQELTPEQAGKNAQVYIRVAQAEYCSK